MQICRIVLGVIFVLSTIVAVTDCCSSRILLLKRREIVQQHNQYAEELQLSQQQQAQLSAAPIDIDANLDFKQNYTDNFISSTSTNVDADVDIESTTTATYVGDDDDTLLLETSTADVDRISNEMLEQQPTLEKRTFQEQSTVDVTEATVELELQPTLERITLQETSTMDFAETTVDPELVTVLKNGSNESVANSSSLGPQHADGAKFHVIDIYYNIMRDVLSFECSGQYLTDFCLNGGRCFRYPVGNHSFFSCECADGYVGERCESKSINGLYARTAALSSKQPKIRTARIVFSFPMLIYISFFYIVCSAIIVIKCPHKQRAAGRHAEQGECHARRGRHD